MFDKEVVAQARADRGLGLDGADWEGLDAGQAPANPASATDVRTAVDSSAVSGVALGVVLAARPLGSRSDAEVLDHIRGWAQGAAHAHAMLLMEVAELMSRRDSLPLATVDSPLAHAEFVSAEIAAALRVSDSAAHALIDQAQQMTTRLGATHDALLAGLIDAATARVIMVETACVADDKVAAVEAAALGRARTGTAAQVRAFTRRIAVKLDPATARVREVAAVKGRHVTRGQTYDGVGELGAVLPVGDLDRVWATLDAHARAIEATGGDDRSLDEKRADVLVQMITSPDTLHPLPGGVRYTDVTVAATTLAGHDDDPGHLAGYGPVTAQTARDLAATSTWRRVDTDAHDHATGRSRKHHHPAPDSSQPRGTHPTPVPAINTGDRARLDALLDEAITTQPAERSTDTYRPRIALTDHVDAVHRHCRYVGCRRPARACDKDHIHAWRPDGRGGRTCAKNMIPLCRFHHRMKHSPGWSVHLHPDHSVTWTTPTRHQWTNPPPTVWD